MGDGGRRRGGGIVAVGRSGGAEGGAGAKLGVVAVGRLKAEGLDDLGTKSGVSSILHECLSRNVMHVKFYDMFCLFVCLFIEGPLSVITILVLELLDSKGLCSVWFPDVLQCGEPRPQLNASSQLGAPLIWEIKLSKS